MKSRHPDAHDIPLSRRLWLRVFAVGVLIMVLPCTLIFYSAYTTLEGVLRQAVREQVNRTLDATRVRLDSFFDGFLRLSSQMADNGMLGGALL